MLGISTSAIVCPWFYFGLLSPFPQVWCYWKGIDFLLRWLRTDWQSLINHKKSPLHHVREWNPGYGEDREWETSILLLSYHDQGHGEDRHWDRPIPPLSYHDPGHGEDRQWEKLIPHWAIMTKSLHLCWRCVPQLQIGPGNTLCILKIHCHEYMNWQSVGSTKQRRQPYVSLGWAPEGTTRRGRPSDTRRRLALKRLKTSGMAKNSLGIQSSALSLGQLANGTFFLRFLSRCLWWWAQYSSYCLIKDCFQSSLCQSWAFQVLDGSDFLSHCKT